MHDIAHIRDNPSYYDEGWKKRNLAPQSEVLLALDAKNRQAIHLKETLLAERNRCSAEVAQCKKNGENAENLIARVQQIKSELTTLEAQQTAYAEQMHDILCGLPNIPHESVPYGKDEADNQQVRHWGEPPSFDFTPQEHFVLGESLGMMDFTFAGQLVGSRFVTLSRDLAKLERALASFMLELHIDTHGLTEMSLPVMVNNNSMYNTGQLPKFSEDLYRVSDDYWLIPTAEVPLTNMGANRIFRAEELPQRLTAFTQCFRREAGAAGRDTRGMLRQHQFSKVEMVTLCSPETSFNELERMTECAENVLKQLQLPYRVMLLCSNDMSPSSRKTYDLEVWLPGQNTYREISSCSNCGPYQALRMKGRMKTAKGNVPIHTLNGSGLAVGRTLIAVMENYQQADGSIVIPEALQPWMGGQKVITAKE